MNKLRTESSDLARSGAENTVRLRNWTLAWVATTALAALGSNFLLHFNNLRSIPAGLANLGNGFGMIAGHRKC